MERYVLAVALGAVAGFMGRYLMLRSDYRQYPGYPHGHVTHLSLGFIAALLGALAVPALLEKEFAAVSFLSLAATQFRDIREMERKTLHHLDSTQLVRRGADYIEGISRVFESRNYLVMLIALIASGVTYFGGFLAGSAAGLLLVLLGRYLKQGTVIGQVALIRPGEVRFEGPNLFVEDIHFMNLGSKQAQEKVLKRGMGVIIEPINDNARAILGNSGQRMAIAHDVSIQLGIYRDVDTAEFTPLLRRDLDTGRIGMIILPLEMDMDCLLEAVRRVPVLESSDTRPLQSKAGRGAAD